MNNATQDILDKHQKAVSRAIRLLDGAVTAAKRAADELCAMQLYEQSADVREIESALRIAAAYGTKGYGIARRLEVPSPSGTIRPMSDKP